MGSPVQRQQVHRHRRDARPGVQVVQLSHAAPRESVLVHKYQGEVVIFLSIYVRNT